LPASASIETVLITGGTGLIGSALTQALLERGFHVIILTRKAPDTGAASSSAVSYAQWNTEKQTIDEEAVARADYIIHLAGASVAEKRWTKKRKQEIIDSRVKSGELLVKALKETDNKVKAVITASATGWYGAEERTHGPSPRSGERKHSAAFREEDPAAEDFLGQTCNQWEKSTEPVTKLGIRLVKLRIGIVLSNEGGALKEFKKPLRFGIAAILSNGRQTVSWIHIDDLIRIILFAMDNKSMTGNYNAVAPYPVSNKKLVLQLAEKERGRFFIPVHVPSFILKLILGEMSIEVLKSVTVSSAKIQMEGFIFQYPAIEDAIRQLAGP
jgi:hypothetical protein